MEIRLNVAIFQMELVDDVKDIPLAWTEIERALDLAKSKLPDDVALPVLDFGVLDVESVILAVTGGDDPSRIDAANHLKDRILRNSQVAEVKIFGSPQLEIRTEIDEAKMFALGLSIPQVLSGIQQKNSGTRTGYILAQGERIVLDQNNDLSQVSELENLAFETKNFKSVKLKDFSISRRTILDPPQNIFRWNGKPAIGIGIVAKEGLNIESFGQRIQQSLAGLEELVRPLKLEVVAYQPQRTSDRIDDLLSSLLTGMALIAGLLVFLMGPSTALMVTLMVPVISLIGLFVFYLLGGVLHQISIAAFIISIGQFIDNIVVVVDQMQRKINSGKTPSESASEVIHSLRWPLAFATLTGICAFLPMLSAQGGTADFVTALPLVAMITLVASYFVTLFFTPLVSAHVIKARRPGKVDKVFTFLENFFASLALGPLWRVGTLVLVIFALSLVGLINVKKEFFPESDRNEFVFSFELKQSADIGSTNKILNEVEMHLQKQPGVLQIAAFAGGDIPRFYYNLPNFQKAPQVGQILVTVNPSVDLKNFGLKLEKEFQIRYPQVHFNSVFLQQGPPINAKVEIKFFSEDPERLAEVQKRLTDKLQADPRLRAIRIDERQGLLSLVAHPNESRMASLGMSNQDINSILAFYSTGLPVSVFRFERDPLPLRVRAQENLSMSDQQLLNSIAVRGQDIDFKIGDLVQLERKSVTPVIRRENSQTYLRALADLSPGCTFSDVSPDIQEFLSGMNLKNGERFAMGGDAEGAGEANASIFKVVPMALALLILFLLLEFKSYRKVLIAALALPVTILGVFPGLWLAGAPFGFMSLLGVLALVGISVNNIILLLEALEESGSLEAAIRSRIRAIFLTTTLTLAGLIPLALEDSSLWPPLAWTMISGLITGTIATLIVVPALYRLFFRAEMKAVLPTTLMLALTLFVQVPKAEAKTRITFLEVLSRVEQVADYKAVDAELAGEKAKERANFKEVWLPKVQLSAEAFQRSEDLYSKTGFGEIKAEDKNRLDLKLEIQQKIFDWSSMSASRSAALAELKAAKTDTEFKQAEIKVQKGGLLLGLLKIQAQQDYLRSQIQNLKRRLQDLRRLVDRGRLSKTEILRLEVLQQRAENSLQQLTVDNEKFRSYLATEGILKPAEVIQFQTLQPESVQGLKSAGLSRRILQLQEKSVAIQNQSERIEALALPQLSAFARSVQAEGRNLVDPRLEEVGLRLYWEIPLDGLRSKQSESLNFQKMKIDHSVMSLQLHDSAERTRLLGQIETQLSWREKLKSLAQKATSLRRIEETKFYDGRGGLSDLIEADNIDLELSRDLKLLEYSLLELCMGVELLNGVEIAACQTKSP